EGGGRVDAGGEAGERTGLVRVDQGRLPGRRRGAIRAARGAGRSRSQQREVAVGAEEVGEGVADGVEANPAELTAVAGLQALAEGAGAPAGAEGLLELGQLAFLAEAGGRGGLGGGNHPGGRGGPG